MEKVESVNRKTKKHSRKAPGTQVSKSRYMVNIPENRTKELETVAESNGLAISAFMRQAVLLRLDEIKRQAG